MQRNKYVKNSNKINGQNFIFMHLNIVHLLVKLSSTFEKFNVLRCPVAF